jgi:hypothetical protein
LVVTLVGIDPSFGRHDDAVDILTIGGVVEAGSALEDVERIVVPTQQAVGPAAGDLLARMTWPLAPT